MHGERARGDKGSGKPAGEGEEEGRGRERIGGVRGRQQELWATC